jgi:hypothetical protein
MYTKQEASLIRQKFWTAFGQYLSPIPGAGGEKINWINYKTGVKGISFKMNADNNQAYVSIEISLSDKDLQQQYFNLFKGFKKRFEKLAGKDWDWRQSFTGEHGNEFSRIWIELNGVNIFRQNEWPEIISFLKKHIIALDAFWEEYKPAFEMAG